MKQHPEILPTHTPALFHDAVERAAQVLRSGEVVALPTETVYGLAANALDVKAVKRIFEVKGRPAHNPIIVHVADLEMAKRCAADWPEAASQLAAAFWPGPLTIVVRCAADIPDPVTAGGDTVGIRWPSHPIMQAVIRACGFPLAAPSANRSNEISPTNAAHVANSLGEHVRLIIDGGQSQVGIESTVLDVTTSPPRLLRPGMIHEESLLAVTGALDIHRQDMGDHTLRSPGLLKKHYAPKARLVVRGWRNEAELTACLHAACSEAGARPKQAFVIAHTHIPSSVEAGNVSVIPHDAEAFARALYSELHRCDAEGARLILVEELPSGSEWRAISDRLQRAAAP